MSVEEGFDSGRRKIFFFSPQRSDRLCGPPDLLANGYRSFSLQRVNNAEMKNVWSYNAGELYLYLL
jgi:hypothetical protein